MKILITGSSGFVGSYLIKKLANKHELIRYDLKNRQDVLNRKLLAKKLKGVDLVIHLAALISANESWKKPQEYFNNNSLGTLNVITEALTAGVKKIIFFSSAAVLAKPFTPYAVSKLAAEEIVKLYSDKINCVIVRPENIYGLGQKEDYGYVIHSFIKAVATNKSIKIYGNGNQSRDFIYIDDVIKVTEKLIKANVQSATIVSLGTGKETKVIELAKLVMRTVGKDVEIKFVNKRVEPVKSVADVRFLVSLGVKVKKFTDLKSGIKKLM
jgi:UDP-glucose 4-epimerase